MKVFIIITIVIEVLQIIAFFAVVMTDTMETSKKENYIIQSKRDVLRFLIPYFWVIPMTRGILKWWYSLK